MDFDLGTFLGQPWGVVIAVLVLLTPRLMARHRDPHAMRRFGGSRLALGYAVAIATALAVLALAEPLQVRPWIEATPVRTVRELAAASPWVQYLLAALIAWLFAAYLVAPLAAWLGSYGRANGLLLALVCLPVAAAIGVALCFAWAERLSELPFTVASACSLVLAVTLGFSVGAGLPLVIRPRVSF